LIYTIDSSGNVLCFINGPGITTGSLEYFISSFWVTDWDSTDSTVDQFIHQIALDGTILASYDVNGFNPGGIAYDGSNSWFPGYINNRTIYKSDITDVQSPSSQNHRPCSS